VIGGRKPPKQPPALSPDMIDAWQTIVKDLSEADVIDHADGGVIEAAAVFWGRAREARAAMMEQDILIKTPQGPVPNRLLTIERDSWREFRALAESLPLSPWGRARLGIKTRGPRSTIDADIGTAPRSRGSLALVPDPDDV
jgi:P27 family predicted phage terminase small subunit